MTVFFRPDTVLPGDPAGFGTWLLGHYLEHKQFIQIAIANNLPPAPDFDILSWSDDPLRSVFWRNVHQQIHLALREQSGVSGIDLSLVDFTDDGDFLVWQQDHATEHQQLRAFYGVT